jgi:REP-associated tyrosine transposase
MLGRRQEDRRAQGTSYTGSGTPLLESCFLGSDGSRMTRHPGHQALRKGRVSVPGQIYLLTTTTAKRAPWFLDMENARTVSRLMVDPTVWGDACVLCWVLMPDHWHGLVELGERDGISLLMNRFKAISTKTLAKTGCSKPVWAHGFHDHALRRDEDVTATARYIVANPIRADLVHRALDYP